MRVNTPVTNVEREYRDGETIVSKTDLGGRISYVNPYFCEMSGFTEQELMGQPQNIIRHPDMPPEAFADLWDTIKSGRPWTGFVKNRCKNGDHYWVEANVTPIRESGTVVGYMSVRGKPGRIQVEEASRLYQLMKEGKAPKTNHLGKLKLFSDMSISRRLLLLAAFCSLTLLGVAWLGLAGRSEERRVGKECRL